MADHEDPHPLPLNEPDRNRSAPRRLTSRHRQCLLLALPWLLISCAEPAAQNFVLITVDTLRADHLGAYDYAEARTPAFDRLASESIQFENAFAHASVTVPSMASLLTGLLPSQHGLYGNGGELPESLPTIATLFQDAGFRAAAFLGNYALRPSRKLDRGFEYYTDEYTNTEGIRDHPENRAGALNRLALDWLDTVEPDQRFFLWVHYQEPHGPYEPPDYDPPSESQGELILPQGEDNSGLRAIPTYQWIGHGRLADYEARYDGEIREMDRHLGDLLSALRERQLLDRSVLLFTADHGESLGENDLYFSHGQGLDDALLRVPLLLRIPGHAAVHREDQVGLIDVMATLVDLFNLGQPEQPGRSLMRDEGDRIVISQMGRRRGRRWRSIRTGRGEIYDLPRGWRERVGFPDKGAGVTEEARLKAQAERDEAAEILERLAPWPPKKRRGARLSEEERRNLKALGYGD